MARAQDDSSSLRFSRRESARVMVALLLSLLIHAAIWGGYQISKKMGWTQKLHPPAWLQLQAKKHPPQKPTPNNNEPTIFVDVSQADADAPVNPKYYSYRNSHAANPVEAKSNVPQISGKQKDVPKTEDVEKVVKKTENNAKPEKSQQTSKAQPLMPAPRPAEAEAQPSPGETELLKTNLSINQPSPKTSPQQERPRTVREALAMRNQLPGQMMQQNGGVTRHALTSSLDAKATPFGEYDRAIVEAVTQRWYDLLDSHRYAQDRSGKVTLQFKLQADGTVIEMHTLENTVGDVLCYLCQASIEESAPFAKWPPDMERMIGENFREVTFTFYYY